MNNKLLRTLTALIALVFSMGFLAACGDDKPSGSQTGSTGSSSKEIVTTKPGGAAPALSPGSLPMTPSGPEEKGPGKSTTPAAKQHAPDEKIATVNNAIITYGDYEKESARLQEILLRTGQPPNAGEMDALRKTALENLIDRELLYQKSLARGIEADPVEMKKRLDEIRSQFPTDAEYKAAMSEMGMTDALLQQEFKKGMIIQKFLTDEFVKKIDIPDDELKGFYEGNSGYFKQPETVKAGHILIRVENGADENKKKEAMARIKDIKKRLDAGEDFAKLADEFTEDPGGKGSGGDLGSFPRGQMVQPFDDTAFGLAPGQVSDVVETQFGYHLIKVYDKKPAGVIPFEEVKEQLKEYLKQNRVQVKLAGYLKEIKEKADIQMFLGD